MACTHEELLASLTKLVALLLKPLHQRSILLVCLCGAWRHYLICDVAQLHSLAQRYAVMWYKALTVKSSPTYRLHGL